MTAAAVARDEHLPGEEGTWVLIGGDMVVFAFMFATYLVYRAHDPSIFHRSQKSLVQTFGAVNTILLLTSSLCVALSITAIRAGRGSTARRLVPVAFSCGLVFIALKVVEYSEHVREHETPSTNDFWLFFYVLTGLHLFHLVVGMIALVFIWVSAARAEHTPRQLGYVEGAACFWHLVDLLWIVLFPLLYLVG